MATLFRLMLAFGAGLVLAACSTMGGPNQDRPLNPLLDDIASVVIAFDLPRGLGPAPGSLFTFDVTNGGPGEHLRVGLQQADVDALPAGLPPPGMDRAYYLFVFSAPDQQALRDAQITAQLNNAVPRSVEMGFFPRLCAAGPLDPNRLAVSVHAVLPGRPAGTFINQMRLADLMRQTGMTTLPACS